MKFNLSDFLQLDTKELLAVNGGSPCSSSSGSPSGSSSGSPSGGSSGRPSGSSSGRPSGSSSGRFSNGSGAPSSSSTNSSDGGTKTIYIPYGPFYGEQVTVRTKGNNKSSKNGNNDNSSKTVPEAWSGGSGSSGGGSCSTSTSNNPNGQGPSTTSSNPGGNQHKDTKIHSGGGTCTKTGGHSPVNPNPTNPDDVTSGGGTCSSKNDTDKVSGMFGQITDGAYADELTMQKYKNEPYKYQPNLDEKMNGDGNTFSHQGCLMTAVAKIASEVSGKEIDPYLDVNQKIDKNKYGKLSVDEISNGLNSLLDDLLGDIYDVNVNNIENVNLSDLQNNVSENLSTTTYVLGFAPDCYGGHWVVLEGYNVDSSGRVSFSYDGTSDNDNGRSYILGTSNQNTGEQVYGISRIETVSITRK